MALRVKEQWSKTYKGLSLMRLPQQDWGIIVPLNLVECIAQNL
jgi:hypothetical protein